MTLKRAIVHSLISAVVGLAPSLDGWACELKPGVGSASVRVDDASDLLAEIEQKLSKGLTVTVVHEVAREGQEPLVFGCKVYYDLWDEAYSVTPFKGSIVAGKDKQTVKDKRALIGLCHTAGFAAKPGDKVEVTTYLDPVSDEQLEKTRRWLAEKGISNSSGRVFGRAAYAMVNLKQQKSVTRACKWVAGAKP